MFIVFGALGLWFGRGLEVGDAQQMGPGFAPMAISIGLVALGTVALLKALLKGTAPIETVSPRAVFGIAAALGVFAASIATLGLVAASVLTVFAACLIEPKLRWKEAVLLSAGLSLGAIALFVWLLRIPFRVWPVWPV
jgi:AcrR family transcriptional regulator